MPEVSVIMGIYNCEDKLRGSIESIIYQTIPDWELILCDDYSEDDTYEIANQYASRYNNIKLLKNSENMGLAYTLNKCLQVAKGSYIARMDADDISLPDRFKKQVDFLNNNPEYELVGSSVILYDEHGDRAMRVTKEYPNKYDLVKGAPFIHPTIMMRKGTFETLNGYTVSKRTLRGQDLDLWFRFFAKGFKAYNIQKPLLKYHESLSDYKKRSLTSRWLGVKTLFIGFRKLKLPLIYYVFLLKPIIAGLVPKKIMYYYHKSVKGYKL